MAKKSSKNNDLLKDVKNTTSPKIYKLVTELVNKDREDLAEGTLKVDYLLTYANNCIKQRDRSAANEALESAMMRMKALEKEGVNIEHLQYIYNEVKKRK